MRPIDADAYAAEMKKRQDACWHLLEDAKENGGVSFEGIDRLNAIYATFSEAKLTLDEMPTIGGWISVKDRLPDKDCEVIIYDADAKAASIGCWIGRQFYEPYGYNQRPFENVTQWMPLPEPPKEENDNEDAQS